MKRAYWISMGAAIVAVTLLSVLAVRGRVEATLLLNAAAVVSAGFAAIVSVYTARATARARQLNSRQGRIFVIYAHADLPAAQRLMATLGERGIEFWIDVEQVLPGEVVERSMRRGLSDSAAALFLVSEHSAGSSSLRALLKGALTLLNSEDDAYSSVIPVVLDGSEPPTELQGVRAVDLRQPDAYDQLTRWCKHMLARTKDRASIS